MWQILIQWFNSHVIIVESHKWKASIQQNRIFLQNLLLMGCVIYAVNEYVQNALSVTINDSNKTEILSGCKMSTYRIIINKTFSKQTRRKMLCILTLYIYILCRYSERRICALRGNILLRRIEVEHFGENSVYR